MSALPATHATRVVIVVCDGLRPEFVGPSVTPSIQALREEGVWFDCAHAVYPTDTRLNSATIATGCQPGHHGLVGNTMYIPAVAPDGPLDVGDQRALQAIDRASGGELVRVDTLGERLRALGRSYAVVSSGSAGSAFMQNPRLAGPIINTSFILPEDMRAAVEARCGSQPPEAIPNTGWNDWVTSVLTEYVLPDLRPDVAVLWLSEPDHTQHPHGLGSPLSLAAIAHCDACIGRVREAVRQVGWADTTAFLVISDHGYSTITAHVDVKRELVEAGLASGDDPGDLVVAANGVFLRQPDEQRLAGIAAFLRGQEWCGPLFSPGGAVPGTLPAAALWGGWEHPRAPHLGFSFAWSNAPNAYGIAGSARGGAGKSVAGHGSLSPYDLRPTLVAAGPGLKRGLTSDAPCGLTDVAPTVLALLGLEPPPQWDGRVLREALVGGPLPRAVPVERRAVSTTMSGFRQCLAQSRVGLTTYLERGWVERA